MPVKDEFVNQAYLSVTESGANTITFSKLETGISLYEKVAWVICRMDYFLSILGSNFAAEADEVQFGLTVLDSLTSLSLSQNAVVDFNTIQRVDYGTAASGFAIRKPFTKTFADLPGGGLMVPPNPIYIAVMGVALTSAVVVAARMFYTVKELKGEDFWELVEQRRMIGV